jgi:hypothetical protein
MNKVIEENESQGNTSNSDNMNENGKRCKRTRNRLTKKQQFTVERQELIMELNNILGVTEDKKNIILYDVEKSEEIYNKVIELNERIKKYFKCGGWNWYIQENSGGKAMLIGLIRALYRDEGWIMTKKESYIVRNGMKVRSVIYYLIKE